MKLDIDHHTIYRYSAPVRSSTQILRLTPQNGAGQQVLHWKLDTTGGATRTRDGYGNVLHVLTLDSAVEEIHIHSIVAAAFRRQPVLMKLQRWLLLVFCRRWYFCALRH